MARDIRICLKFLTVLPLQLLLSQIPYPWWFMHSIFPRRVVVKSVRGEAL